MYNEDSNWKKEANATTEILAYYSVVRLQLQVSKITCLNKADYNKTI